MNNKHVSKKKNNKNGRIIHCPCCRGVIFKNFNINEIIGEITFSIRCQHCNKMISVAINKKIYVSHNGKVK